jgi:hypothetical protein
MSYRVVGKDWGLRRGPYRRSGLREEDKVREYLTDSWRQDVDLPAIGPRGKVDANELEDVRMS